MDDQLHEELAENGAKGGNTTKSKGKQYYSELGKRSAAKRAQMKKFDSSYYSELGKRSAAKKKGIPYKPNPIDAVYAFLIKGKV